MNPNYREAFQEEYIPERRGFRNIAWLLTAALIRWLFYTENQQQIIE